MTSLLWFAVLSAIVLGLGVGFFFFAFEYWCILQLCVWKLKDKHTEEKKLTARGNKLYLHKVGRGGVEGREKEEANPLPCAWM